MVQALLSTDTDLTAAIDSVEVIYEALHELWELRAGSQWSFPSSRMPHLLTLLGAELTTCTTLKLSHANAFWSSDPSAKLLDVQLGLQLMRQWEQHVRNLLYDWTTGASARSWDGASFVDVQVADYIDRLDEVHDLIALRIELMSSLDAEQTRAAGFDAAFSQLDRVQSLQVSGSVFVFTTMLVRSP